MRILVTGRDGQLGKSIKKIVDKKSLNNCEFVFVGRKELDLGKIEGIKSYFRDNFFDVVVNCAAYTNVDKAEFNKKEANLINHTAVKEIARVAKRFNMGLIHFSTDFVFDGYNNKPYVETDVPSPLNIYGNSKLAGEISVLSIMKSNAIVLRTGWVYSEYGNNFVEKILNLTKNNSTLNVVSDQIGSPTYAHDLAQTILKILDGNMLIPKKNSSEIYHYSNEGSCSWFDFANEIVTVLGIDCSINPINSIDYPTPAKRPKFSLLSKSKISQQYDLKINNWQESLKICLNNI